MTVEQEPALGVYFDPGLSIWVLTKGDGRGLRGSMPFAETFIVIACYAIGINLAGFLAFAWDKHCARNGMWRVPERTLLTLAAYRGNNWGYRWSAGLAPQDV